MDCLFEDNQNNQNSAIVRLEIERDNIYFPYCCLGVEPPIKSLYVRGDVTLLNLPAISIVGARKATPYGLSCAKHFARLAAESGITVVSGGAIGCDQSAHRGALMSGGKTIVVLGCGADVVYPKKAADLFEQVLEAGGAIISEAPWSSPPSRFGFRRRNRIIAGLGCATLIVEAGLPSGTFSTADTTLAMGKDVLVVPGSIHSKESYGSNQLLLQGALPVVDDQSFVGYLTDILGSSVIEAQAKRILGAARATDRERAGLQISEIEAALISKPMSVEEISALWGGDVTATIRELSALEFIGKIVRLRDGRYTISESCRYTV